MAIANIGDCTVNEGGVYPCIILGIDFGGILYTMGVAGWLIFYSIPWGFLGLILGIFVFIAELFGVKF